MSLTENVVIDLKNKFRTASNTDFQKALFKLKNNLIFGKTIQNNRKQRDVWHANNEKKLN